MKYDLDGTSEAKAQFAMLWITQVANRSTITQAAARIDLALATDPLKNATPKSEGLFAIDMHPLRAIFEILDNRVIVVGLHWLTESG